jgi:CubicO group peptidase (beta-lactamase class C family)
MSAALTQQIEEICSVAENAGLPVGVLHKGKLWYKQYFGLSSGSGPEKPDDDTLDRLGSLTKALTVAGLGILVDEGKISWDSLFKDVIPGFHQRDKEAEANATVMDLLAHRRELAMRMNHWAQMQQGLSIPDSETVNILGSLHKIAEFRATIKYNHWTYAITGQIIKRLSKCSLGEFVRVHFFEPLGLRRTAFGFVTDDNYAGAYITLSDGTPCGVPRPNMNGTITTGAAGLKSGLCDLLTPYDAWLSALEDQRKTGLTVTPGSPFR